MRDKLHELEEMAAQMFSDRRQPSAEPDLSQRSSFDQDIAKQDPCPANSGISAAGPTADAELKIEVAATDQWASPLNGLGMERVIHLRWVLRDIKAERTRLSPLNTDDLKDLVEMGLVEVRDGVPLLTSEGDRALHRE